VWLRTLNVCANQLEAAVSPLSISHQKHFLVFSSYSQQSRESLTERDLYRASPHRENGDVAGRVRHIRTHRIREPDVMSFAPCTEPGVQRSPAAGIRLPPARACKLGYGRTGSTQREEERRKDATHARTRAGQSGSSCLWCGRVGRRDRSLINHKLRRRTHLQRGLDSSPGERWFKRSHHLPEMKSKKRETNLNNRVHETSKVVGPSYLFGLFVSRQSFQIWCHEKRKRGVKQARGRPGRRGSFPGLFCVT